MGEPTGAARLREALEEIVAKGGPYVCGQHAYEMARIAREALAAVPEETPPTYEWRAVQGYYCHYARPLESMAREDAARFKEESPADAHRIYVERRTAPGPWERVEEGTT